MNDSAARDAMTLGTRILIVMCDGTASEALVSALASTGHQVRSSGADAWQAARLESQPEIVLLHGQDAAAVARLCREMKCPVPQSEDATLPPGPTAPVAAVLPAAVVDQGGAAGWEALAEAGCDDLLTIETLLSPQLQVRLEVLTGLGQLRRQLHDMTELVLRQMQLDDVTQVHNRPYFFHAANLECNRARRYGHPMSCLMVDVDHFKLLTSSFGYACGDHVLRQVAGVLRRSTRDSDFVARFSESKFVVLLTETPLAGASATRAKIEQALDKLTIEWQGQQVVAQVTIGEAEVQPPPAQQATPGSNATAAREQLTTLLEAADAALYATRKATRRTPR